VIPAGAALRVVGDVHGDAAALERALATERFVIQLGDLVDCGPDSAGAARLMARAVAEGRGLFLMGNHDHKLARALAGRAVRADAALAATLAALDGTGRAAVLGLCAAAPYWVRDGARFFVHGGFHTSMLSMPSPRGVVRAEGAVARALYGEPTGRTQADGYPERSLAWVERIPPGLTVFCGHDRRSVDGRPATRRNARGGTAVFLDTGAGKGGHLSWLDLPGAAEPLRARTFTHGPVVPC
jgi:protein phosphatase